MNDLMASKRWTGRDQFTPLDVEAALSTSGTGTAAQANDTSKALASFFVKVDEIQADIADVKAKKWKLQQLHERSKAAVTQQEAREARASMQATVSEVHRIVLGTKAKLQALAKNNADALQVKGQGAGSASERTRTSITCGLMGKLQEVMGQFNGLRVAMNEEYRETVRNRIYAVTGQHCAEEDVDRAIETGEAEGIFAKAMQEQGRGRVLDLVADIRHRHSAIKALDVSLQELCQLFQEVAALVVEQGHKVDNIAINVARCTTYVEHGTEQIVEARTVQKRTRKCALYGGIAAAVLVLIIILVLVLTIRPR